MILTFSIIYWDPKPEMFHWNIPLLGRPILWYGFLFAVGFLIGYKILLSLLRHYSRKEVKQNAKFFAEKLTLYVVLGTVIGARLGDVLFYQSWHQILRDPFSVIKFWEGGLASHGGAVGILIALGLFSRRYHLNWKEVLDWVAIPTGVAGFFIRIGNFVNQEILGTKTSVPWGVVFGHPADGSIPAPRHPVQLYEAFFYLAVFFLLYFWARPKKWPPGKIGGLFITLVFLFRFCIEFFKEEQSAWFSGSIDMGQLLSLPLIGLGLFLLARKK